MSASVRLGIAPLDARAAILRCCCSKVCCCASTDARRPSTAASSSFKAALSWAIAAVAAAATAAFDGDTSTLDGDTGALGTLRLATVGWEVGMCLATRDTDAVACAPTLGVSRSMAATVAGAPTTVLSISMAATSVGEMWGDESSPSWIGGSAEVAGDFPAGPSFAPEGFPARTDRLRALLPCDDSLLPMAPTFGEPALLATTMLASMSLMREAIGNTAASDASTFAMRFPNADNCSTKRPTSASMLPSPSGMIESSSSARGDPSVCSE
mmetsp:Transcript_18386/g.52688  ORF Transcript_18386/g.52688 Transcript_18386/m.52688 type:complete len:269 (-) Transcript_18386:1509-2315(-)